MYAAANGFLDTNDRILLRKLSEKYLHSDMNTTQSRYVAKYDDVRENENVERHIFLVEITAFLLRDTYLM